MVNLFSPRKATDQMGADQLQTMMDEAEKAYDGGLHEESIWWYGGRCPNGRDSRRRKHQ